MSLNIISNYAANVAHRNLASSAGEATASLAKLSSGTRVLSAKDDAAAMAIGSRINSEVQSLKQAGVNAGQASSMLEIADGAMGRVQDILTRMKTLAVQAASDQLASTERGMLNTEYQALLSEVDRIAENTQFNNQNLVNGSTDTATTQNGMASADNLLKAADGFHSIKLDSSVGDAAFKVGYDSTTNVLTVTNVTTGASEGINIGAAAIGTNESQSVRFSNLGVSIELNSAFDKTSDIAPSGDFTAAGAGAGAISDDGVRVVSASAGGGADLTTNVATISGADAATAVLTIEGYTSAAVNLTDTGLKTATFTNGDGDSFTVEFVVTTAFDNAATAAGDGTLAIGGLGAMVYGEEQSATSTDFTYKVGTGTSASNDLTFTVDSINANALGINGTSVDGADGSNANTAIDALTGAIDALNVSRANVGSAQNRLEFASANLATLIENQEAARSQLLDLDVASEMSHFTSKQMLMQAGVSMLAQANQLPQNLLRLLG